MLPELDSGGAAKEEEPKARAQRRHSLGVRWGHSSAELPPRSPPRERPGLAPPPVPSDSLASPRSAAVHPEVTRMKVATVLVLIAAALTLTACGGEGSGSGSAKPAGSGTAAAGTGTAAAKPAGTGTGTGGW